MGTIIYLRPEHQVVFEQNPLGSLKKITQKQLDVIQVMHEIWLNNPFNGKCANLSHCDLSGLKFSRTFEKANLSYSNLENANLRGCCFSQANFDFSNLCNSEFAYSKCPKASFYSVKANGASFFHALLFQTNFNNSSVKNVDFNHANIEQSHFNDVDASDSCFSCSDLYKTSFLHSNLNNVSFIRANMDSSVLIDCSIENSKFLYATLSNSFLSEPIIQIGPFGSMKEYIVFRPSVNKVFTKIWNNFNEGPLDEFIKYIEITKDIDDATKADIRRAIIYFRSYENVSQILS